MNCNGGRMEPEATRLIDFESATDFTCFESLHNIVLDIDDQLLCVDVQMAAGQMYDKLRRLLEMF